MKKVKSVILGGGVWRYGRSDNRNIECDESDEIIKHIFT